ncbi:phosphate ABC transporter substrate-binding protein PstS [Amaricoccus solimangrovi]|uniref:Phosphate-binding protein PstS n=1 Tax=Amaricoccus solimangrovi TaxID=2589815 RepID=A0A501WQI0_9RHOB|nr:phosphate ABC transporter substrate-binding protein PstS [Amaricoccus solimangrovi]TPE52033.1 phosphate ABC transporter substrate-binding protein PstS [Amaricoccus solimangrovi]
MRKLLAALAAAATVAVAAGAPAHAETRLTGSGASFPFPIYAAWFKDFSSKSDGVTVDYQSKGSGAGIQDLINGVVDFAASDAAMSDEEISKVSNGVVLLPMTAGEIVLAYNLPGVSELKLPRDVYPEIFAGKIQSWNDPKIAEANPGVELPDTPITVVVRSDSSGTTFNFTNHLAAVDPVFKEEVGADKSVQWPTLSTLVKAPKNDGVTATILQTPGAIGYVEYGYAKMTGAPMASLENAKGEFVAPGGEGGPNALASAEFDTNMRAFIVDPQGEGAYPMATFTWMLFYKSGQDDEKVKAIKEMVEYGLTDGQAMADDLGYIPMPEAVIEKVRAAAEQIGASS